MIEGISREGVIVNGGGNGNTMMHISRGNIKVARMTLKNDYRGINVRNSYTADGPTMKNVNIKTTGEGIRFGAFAGDETKSIFRDVSIKSNVNTDIVAQDDSNVDLNNTRLYNPNIDRNTEAFINATYVYWGASEPPKSVKDDGGTDHDPWCENEDCTISSS